MSVRSCVYHGCENYSSNGVPLGHYVIFSFPKDLERREKWMKLGNVDRSLPPKALFMCSEHFEQKYISVNQYRTLLLKTALPREYKESNDCEQSNNSDEALNEHIRMILKSELLTEEECTNTTECGLQRNNDTTEHYEADLKHLNEFNNSNFTIQFEKCSEASGDESNSEEIKVNTSPSRTLKRFYHNTKKSTIVTLTNKKLYRNHNENDSYPAAKNRRITQKESDISTFIYDGKEYVQMPKDVYLQERNDLLYEVNRYKALFKNIKEKLKAFGDF